MKKRIAATALAAVTLITQFGFGKIRTASAAEKTPDAREQAIGVIQDLNLLTVDDFSSENIIARRDLAEIAVKMLGITDKQKARDTVFADVAKSDEKSGYIQEAYDRGIFNGYFDGSFYPFEAVTCNEAIKVMASVAGYKEYAEKKGGYPYGYISVAKEAGITDGMSLSGEKTISLGNLSRLIVNTLEAGIMTELGIEGEDVDYAVSSGVTLLSKSFDCEIVKGRLTEDYMTSLAGASSLERNQVKIDDVFYLTDEENIHAYLGKTLVCYVNENDKIVTFYEPRNKNTEITVYSKDVLSITPTEIKYKDENGKKCSTALYDGADFIYNGLAQLAWSYNDIPRENAEIRFLDSDGDNLFDVIFVNNYTNLIVDRYVAEDELLHFINAPTGFETVSVAKDDNVRYSLTDATGSVVDISEVQSYDILSLARSVDKTVCEIHLCRERIEGECTAQNDTDADIDSVTYRVDPKLDAASKYGDIKMGKKGVFYLNWIGEIAAVSYDVQLLKSYAYITDIAANNKGLKNDVYVKMFDGDGEFYTRKLADKLKINGTRKADKDIFGETSFYSAGAPLAQLVTYETNADGDISEINSAKAASAYTEEERENHFTLGESLTSVQYRAGNMHMFASRYFITNDTVIFIIPDDTDSEDDFQIIKRSSLVGDRTYETVKLYDIDRNSKAGAMVMGFTDLFFEAAAPSVGVIEKTVHCTDSEGNDAIKLTVKASVNPTTLVVKTDQYAAIASSAIVDLSKEAAGFVSHTASGISYISPEKLKRGDVIQYIMAPSGKVSQIHLAYRAGTQTFKEVMGSGSISKNNAYAIKYYTYATVDKLLDNAVRISVPAADGSELYERAFPFIKNTAVFKFDTGTNTLEEYSQYRIAAGDNVFIYCQSSNLKLVVVYK